MKTKKHHGCIKNEQLKLQLLPGEEYHKHFIPIIIDAACHSCSLCYIITSSLANYTNNILFSCHSLIFDTEIVPRTAKMSGTK